MQNFLEVDALINNCLSGNHRSQKALYDQFSGKMYAVCLRYSRNQMDAEDILQEGFVKLFNNLHRFRNEGSFDGWVRRIFVNTAIEHIRKRQLVTQDSEGLENSIESRYYSGYDSLVEKDLLRTASNLSTGYKTVFNMYVVEGYSHKEIAKTLGITESTSKSQYSRAKSILRTMVEAHSHAHVAAS